VPAPADSGLSRWLCFDGDGSMINKMAETAGKLGEVGFLKK